MHGQRWWSGAFARSKVDLCGVVVRERGGVWRSRGGEVGAMAARRRPRASEKQSNASLSIATKPTQPKQTPTPITSAKPSPAALTASIESRARLYHFFFPRHPSSSSPAPLQFSRSFRPEAPRRFSRGRPAPLVRAPHRECRLRPPADKTETLPLTGRPSVVIPPPPAAPEPHLAPPTAPSASSRSPDSLYQVSRETRALLPHKRWTTRCRPSSPRPPAAAAVPAAVVGAAR